MDHLEIQKLRNGVRVFVRPVRPSDKRVIARGFKRLSRASRYNRFFSNSPCLSDEMLKRFTEVDHYDCAALCAGVIQQNGWCEAGIIRYARDAHRPDTAEIALVIVDDFQNLGLGSMLFGMLKQIAVRNGIRSFYGHVLPENHAMIHLLQKWHGQGTWEPGACFRYEIELIPDIVTAV